MGTMALAFAVMAAVLSGLGLARPQGGLPISDLIPGPNLQVRPDDGVTLFDLTSDSLNEVNAPDLTQSSSGKLDDDVTFQFPSSPGNRPSPYGQGTGFPVRPPLGNRGQGQSSGNPGFNSPGGNSGYGLPGSSGFGPTAINSGFGPHGGSSGFELPSIGNSGFGSPRGNSGFGSPGGDSGFGPPGSEPGFGSPRGNSGFGSPRGNSGFGTPGGNFEFGSPGRDSGFGPPGGNPGFGPPGGNPGFGSPRGNSEFKSTGGSSGSGPPEGSSAFGLPGGNSGFGSPTDSSGFGAILGNSEIGSPGGSFSNTGFGPAVDGSGFRQTEFGSFEPSFSPSSSPPGISGQVSGSPRGAPGPNDFKLNFPDSFPPVGVGSSAGVSDFQSETSVLPVESPGSDIHFAFPDTSPSSKGPSFPTGPDPGFSSPPQSETTLVDLTFPSPAVPINDVPISDLGYDSADPAKSPSEQLEVLRDSPSGGGVGLPEVPIAASERVVSEGPQRSLGDGNRKVLRNRISEEDELLALLTLGLIGNRQPSARAASYHRDAARNDNPILKLLNLLTFGIFDSNRHRPPHPINNLLSRLTGGIIGNGTHGSSNKPAVDLEAIGLGPDALDSLVQVANAGLDDIARETSSGLRLVGDEVQFMSREKIQNIIKNFQQSGRTFSFVGQNTYRSVLQKQDAIGRLLMGLVENLGNFANTTSSKAFEKVGDTATTIGRFINNLKEGLLEGLISKGEAIRELFSSSLDTTGRAFNDFTTAARYAAEDNIRAITGIRPFR